MFSSQWTFIGIDPTAGRRPLIYAALNHELRLEALGRGDMNEVLAFVGGCHQALVAINAPQRPAQGLMDRQETRARLSPPPRPGRWAGFRLVEYLLRQMRINCPRTPAAENEAPAWMQRGFTLYHRLAAMGFTAYPQPGPLRYLEVYPHASFSVWLQKKPLPKQTLEGRLQRQLVLYEEKLDIPDPMEFFEEITRHRLRQGILPTSKLYTTVELEALTAAYMAWLVNSHPDQVTLLGDPLEGQIVLPAAELKARY